MISTHFRHFILSTPRDNIISTLHYELLYNSRFQYLVYGLAIFILICIILLFINHYFEVFFILGIIMLAIYCVTFSIRNTTSEAEFSFLNFAFFGNHKEKTAESKPKKEAQASSNIQLESKKKIYIASIEKMFLYKRKTEDEYDNFLKKLQRSKIDIETNFDKFKMLYKNFDKDSENIKDELLGVDISLAVYDYELEKFEKALWQRFILLNDTEDNEQSNNGMRHNETMKKDADDKAGSSLWFQEKRDLHDFEINGKSSNKIAKAVPDISGDQQDQSGQEHLRNEKQEERYYKLAIYKNEKEKTKICYGPCKTSKNDSCQPNCTKKDVLAKECTKLQKLHGLIAGFAKQTAIHFDAFQYENKNDHIFSKNFLKLKKNQTSDSNIDKQSNKIQDQRQKDSKTNKKSNRGEKNKKVNTTNIDNTIDLPRNDDFKEIDNLLLCIRILFLVEGTFSVILFLLYFSNYIHLGTGIRVIFLLFMICNISMAILLMIEAQLMERKYSKGDLDSCKSQKQLAAEDIMTELSRFMKLPRNNTNIQSVKEKLKIIANDHLEENKKLAEYISILTNTDVVKLIETFDYLFKKIEFIEDDFENIMEHKVDKGRYYTNIKKMKILLDKIETELDDVKTNDVMSIYTANDRINVMFDTEKNNIENTLQSFMSDDAKDIAQKNGEKCKNEISKMSELGTKTDQFYFVLAIVSMVLMICVCI